MTGGRRIWKKTGARRSRRLTQIRKRRNLHLRPSALRYVRIAPFREDFTTDFRMTRTRKFRFLLSESLLFFPIREIREIRG
jgi:hypothetical protein